MRKLRFCIGNIENRFRLFGKFCKRLKGRLLFEEFDNERLLLYNIDEKLCLQWLFHALF